MQEKKPLLSCFLLLYLLIFFCGQVAAAKKNNDAPVNMESAVKTAKIVVNKLAKGEKIDKSWLKINAKSAIVRQYPHGTEWVIAFNNRKIKKVSHRTLYIFLTLSGKYVAANYTGQ